MSLQTPESNPASNPAFERIQREIGSADVVLFMKGVPAAPQCGFSATVVQILSYLGVPFKGVNILADQELRDNLKIYSEWPTFPQLYVKGELVGGCDIIREMFEEGELKDFLAEKGIAVQIA
jgi:monothiol glutaredoxin